MTLRDDIWDDVLFRLVHEGKFKISDLGYDESQRNTVRRVLREMEEQGWLSRESEQASIWRLGPKAEMLMSVDSDVIKDSQP